jgi:glycosyltransferase involved in cell wall biosynthesis
MASVSLIIPCFNHAGNLARAIASGLAQSALHEIIVVDDHSTDASSDLARELAAGDTRIRLMQTERNIGAGGARNAGVRAACGSHVSFLDADDELLGDFFQEALDLMAAQPEMLVVKPEEEFFDPVKGYILPSFDPRHQAAVLSSVHGLVMDRASFERMGGFPEAPVFRGPFAGEDVALMAAVIKYLQPIGRIDRPCYRVWSQAGSHVDKFLANTRLTEGGFEFVSLHADQQPGGALESAVEAYLDNVQGVLTDSVK